MIEWSKVNVRWNSGEGQPVPFVGRSIPGERTMEVAEDRVVDIADIGDFAATSALGGVQVGNITDSEPHAVDLADVPLSGLQADDSIWVNWRLKD